MKLKGISFIDFVDFMDSHGYNSIESLRTLEPNPLKWNKKQWTFAVDLIAKSSGETPKFVREHLTKPSELLKAFNEALRKTGLIIQLTQISQISDKSFVKTLKPKKPRKEWDVTYSNV